MRKLEIHDGDSPEVLFPPELAEAFDRARIGGDLHWAGNIALVARIPRIAVVGTRHPGKSAVAATEALAIQLSRAGSTIVSGAARGIDMAAHAAVLHSGGSTIACVPLGLDCIDFATWRTEFAGLGDDLERLLLLSPFHRRQPPTRQTPILRNRLIAALAEAVVAGEAGFQSGTHWCLRAALEMGVPVFFMADADAGDERLAAAQRHMESRGARRYCIDEILAGSLAGEVLRAATNRRRRDHRRRRAQLQLFDESPG